jgi:hypothetical protein
MLKDVGRRDGFEMGVDGIAMQSLHLGSLAHIVTAESPLALHSRPHATPPADPCWLCSEPVCGYLSSASCDPIPWMPTSLILLLLGQVGDPDAPTPQPLFLKQHCAALGIHPRCCQQQTQLQRFIEPLPPLSLRLVHTPEVLVNPLLRIALLVGRIGFRGIGYVRRQQAGLYVLALAARCRKSFRTQRISSPNERFPAPTSCTVPHTAWREAG